MNNQFYPLEFPAHILEQGRERMAQSDPQIVDETLTVFAYAMKAIGYTPSLHPAGCVITATCEKCRGSFSQRFEKQHHVYWACPSCRTITPGLFMAGKWSSFPENSLVSDKGYVFWHLEGRQIYDRTDGNYYVVDERGNLTQDDIPDHVLGRIDTAKIEDAEHRRLAWISRGA